MRYDAREGGAELLYDDFKAAVRQVCSSADPAGGLVPIPFVRRALGDRVSAQEFDAFLCALQQEGHVHLLTHVDFDELSAEDRADCLRHPSGVLTYWVCWV
jgi:hypothetical protein